MSDQTPDPTAWDDDQLDDLLDALAKRAAERDDLVLPGTGASRRGVLAGLLGLGGAAAGAGVASAIGESESYGSSSGVVGTDSEPLSEANVQDLHAQDLQVDNQAAVAQRTLGPGPDVEETIDGTISQSGSQTVTHQLNDTYDRVEVHLGVLDPAATRQDIILRVNGDSGSNYNFVDESDARTAGADGFRIFSSLGGARPIEDGVISLSGTFGAHATVSVDSLGTTAAPTGRLSYGANFNVSSPINSITFAGGSGNISVRAVVKGVNLLSI